MKQVTKEASLNLPLYTEHSTDSCMCIYYAWNKICFGLEFSCFITLTTKNQEVNKMDPWLARVTPPLIPLITGSLHWTHYCLKCLFWWASEEQRLCGRWWEEKCQGSSFGRQESCYSGLVFLWPIPMRPGIWAISGCGLDLHIALCGHYCCGGVILLLPAQTLSSSTDGAGCHDSHPGACGIDWLMSLGNGAVGTALDHNASSLSYPRAQQLPIKAFPLI